MADRYANARRGYPATVVDWVLAQAGAGAQRALLEIAPGTGQLTRDLAARGHRVHALELGARLAARAREALAPWPLATVEVGDIETWSLADSAEANLPEAFDLAVCAQAFHWIEPELALPRIADALKPSGRLALIWNLDRSRSLPVYAATTPVYERHGVGGTPLAQRAGGRAGGLAASDRFGEVTTWSYEHRAEYSVAEWLELVQTFSTTLALPPTERAAFLRDLAGVLAAFPSVERRYETVVYLASRLD